MGEKKREKKAEKYLFYYNFNCVMVNDPLNAHTHKIAEKKSQQQQLFFEEQNLVQLSKQKSFFHFFSVLVSIKIDDLLWES